MKRKGTKGTRKDKNAQSDKERTEKKAQKGQESTIHKQMGP